MQGVNEPFAKYKYMSCKRDYHIFVVTFYVLLYRDVLEQLNPVFGYLDETISLLFIPIILYLLGKNNWKIKKDWIKISFPFVILFFIGVMSSLSNAYQPLDVVLMDLLLNVKFWLTIFVGYYITKSDYFDDNKKRLLNHVKLNTVFFFYVSSYKLSAT